MKVDEQHKTEFITSVRAMGFDEGFLENYYDALKSGKQQSSSWQEYKDFGNARVLFEPVLKRDSFGLPYLDGYRATILETHPIAHAVFDQIDTEILEVLLKQGKWLTDPEVFSDLYAQLTELFVNGNSIAKDIAQRLEARYWMGTPAATHINSDWLKKRFGRSHYFNCTLGPGNVPADQAYHLMVGRPILLFEATRPEVYAGYWFGLKRYQEPLLRDGEIVWFEEKRYPGYNPYQMLEVLPLKEMKIADLGIPLFRKLLGGAPAPATIIINGTERPCMICADAEGNRIRLFDANGREFNLLVSSPKKKTEQPLNKKKKPPPFKRNKGNSI